MRRVLISLGLCCLIIGTAKAGDNPIGVRAVRITTPPRLDAVLDEAVWKTATPATNFIQRDPLEGTPASERTEIRVLYDDDALYFGCMFYDSAPSEIVTRLSRRDDETESDGASIRIDSYHDHQTGYEFTFNVSGVKTDILQYDDAEREDDSWDPIWELQTAITPEGWVAEIRIPFSMLHFHSMESDSAENVWGINFLRHISRKQEDQRWAFTPKSQSGFISRYGHLYGLSNLAEPHRFDLLPFATAKSSHLPATSVRDKSDKITGNGGLDMKYSLSSNFTLDATFNPDFGQVEADPAVLNLSTFETFYPEKRPFFIDGTQILHFSTFGGGQGPGMFYSRRIGRGISEFEVNVPPNGRITEIPDFATILGAAKVTGKTNDGLSLGVLQAVTQEEHATVTDSAGVSSRQMLEPLNSYTVVRLKQDVMTNSNVGMIATYTEHTGRPSAITNGYDWSLFFDSTTYALNGFIALSSTDPGGAHRMYGSAGKVNFGRIAAVHWLWNVAADFTSKEYDINDVGFFFSPNDYGAIGSLTYKEDIPAYTVRYYEVNLFTHYRTNFDEENLARQANVGGFVLFTNYWSLNGGINVDYGLYDPRETRGNGLYRKPWNYSANLFLTSDQRSDVWFNFGEQHGWDSKNKDQWNTQIGLNVKPLTWMAWAIESGYQYIGSMEAWFTNTGAGEALFGDRTTHNLSITLRGSITFTRDLTLQVYGQEFFATGHYDNIRQLVSPDEFVPFVYAGNPDFSRQSFNSNIVLRWEYLPGSLLYLVWSQARDGGGGEYDPNAQNNIEATFTLPPTNVLLLKVSYLLEL